MKKILIDLLSIILILVAFVICLFTLNDIFKSMGGNKIEIDESNTGLTAGTFKTLNDYSELYKFEVIQNGINVVGEEIPEQPYTDEELEIMARVISGEAQNESELVKYYVGGVVLNRVKSKYYPNTIEDVVFQKGQYQCTWDGNYDREPSDDCYEIAEDLLVNGSTLPEDVLYQAEFKQGSEVYRKIGKNYFCKK